MQIVEASVLGNTTFRTLLTGLFGPKRFFVLLATRKGRKTLTHPSIHACYKLDRFCFGLRLIQVSNKPAGYHSGFGTRRAKTISYLDISSHFFVQVISYHFSGHLFPSFIMGFNSLMLFFYVSKFTF